MKWLLLPGCLLLIAAIEILRRRASRYDARYVQQLRRWQTAEPTIEPLNLPPVRRLQAQRVETGGRVAAFHRRHGGER